jgi:hypothetical protein
VHPLAERKRPTTKKRMKKTQERKKNTKRETNWSR